nr:hypothetical protein [Burkholderia plantarii]
MSVIITRGRPWHLSSLRISRLAAATMSLLQHVIVCLTVAARPPSGVKLRRLDALPALRGRDVDGRDLQRRTAEQLLTGRRLLSRHKRAPQWLDDRDHDPGLEDFQFAQTAAGQHEATAIQKFEFWNAVDRRRTRR